MKISQAQEIRTRNMSAKTIHEYFLWRQESAGYMSALLSIIKKYAEEVDHITEFGLRLGESTAAMLAAGPKKLITYDIDPHCLSTYNLLNSFPFETEFIFRCEDSYNADIEETDLLFADCSPVPASRIKQVLTKQTQVKKYIMIYDTDWFGEIGLDGGPGLKFPINDFLKYYKEWKFHNHYSIDGGLTVLKRGDQ